VTDPYGRNLRVLNLIAICENYFFNAVNLLMITVLGHVCVCVCVCVDA
jgi:hypothetical protein